MKKCEEVIIKPAEKVKEYTRTCLGVGRTLEFIDGQPRITITQQIDNGWYNNVRVVDNCIVEVGNTERTEIVSPPCVSNPSPCGGGGEGGSYKVSRVAGNIIQELPDGIYAKVHVRAGTGIAVLGEGTVESPYIISGAAIDREAGIQDIVSTSPDSIDVQITNTGIASIALKPTGVVAGNYLGLTVGTDGRITGYTAEETSGVLAVVNGGGVKAETQAGIVTVSLETINPNSNQYIFGAFSVAVDPWGRVSGVGRGISLTETEVETASGETLVINEYGSIAQIKTGGDGGGSSSAAAAGTVFAKRTDRQLRDEEVFDFETTKAGVFLVELVLVGDPSWSLGTPVNIAVNGDTGLRVDKISNSDFKALSGMVFSPGRYSINIKYAKEISLVSYLKVSVVSTGII